MSAMKMPDGNDSGVPFLEEAEIRIREYLELEIEERDELLLCAIWVGWTGRGCALVICRRHLSVGAEPKIQILKRTATCRGCSGHYHRSPNDIDVTYNTTKLYRIHPRRGGLTTVQRLS